jgi:hypothetical protein
VPQPQIIANWAIDGLPIDLKISPDETFAVVRTASVGSLATGFTYLLDLRQPGAPIRLTESQVCDWNSSDFVEVIDDFVVTSTWRGQTSPSLPNRELKTFSFNAATVPPASPFNLTAVDTQLGDTPDVAVAYHATQLAPYAAVRGDGSVSLWDLSSAGLVRTDAFALQACGGTGASLTTAIGCSDSIVMSGSRYAAIGNFQYPINTPPFPIYRASIVVIGAVAGSTANFPAIHPFNGTLPFGGGCTTPEFMAHDVAMTPDGRYSVVSGSQMLAVFRNRDGAMVSFSGLPNSTALPSPRFVVRPSEWQTTDSVEVTNRRIVFIGNSAPFSEFPILPGTPDVDTFRVTIGDIDQPVPSYWHYRPQDVGLAPTAPSRVHDLAITPNGSRAAVTTRAGLLLFDLTAPIGNQHTPPAPPQFFPTAPDPLRFGMNIPAANNFESTSDAVYCSDSVACTDGAVVAISRNRSTPAGGEVFVIDLMDGGVATFSLGTDHVPTDLSISPDGSLVTVRSIHRLGDVGGNASRITVLTLPSGALFADFTNAAPLAVTDLGHALGRDQVDCSNHFAITAGENLPVTWTAQNVSGYTGWIQVLRLK